MRLQQALRLCRDLVKKPRGPARRVVDGPAEWIGTTIDWRLSRHDGFTIVRFTHAGWAEPVEFLSHCSTKWAVFLLSLKALIETGTGSPSPHDVAISDWH